MLYRTARTFLSALICGALAAGCTPVDTGDEEETDIVPNDESSETCTPVRYYRDADDDDLGDPDDYIDACSPTGSYDVTNSDDCCDLDADARPDQTEFFSVENGCGDFDYDCDQDEEIEIALCDLGGGCEDYWGTCPPPDCGVEAHIVQPPPPPVPGGICAAGGAYITQPQACN